MISVIVFSGFNPRAVISFIRTMERRKVRYGIIAKSEHDDIFLTQYAKKVVAIRKTPELNILDIESQIKAAQEALGSNCIIAPSTEALNRYLLQFRDRIEGLGCVVPLVDEEMYSKISDKQSFGRLCRESGIAVPQERSNINQAKIPFVAKPKTYFAGDGSTPSPALIFSKENLERFKANYNTTDFFFQDYITGESLYLLYYFDKNGRVSKFSQKNFIQQPDGKSITAAIPSNIHEKLISNKFESLFLSLKFRGLVMVEIKFHPSTGESYMIEANPRFWGPSQLFVDAGVNLFECFLEDYEVIDEVDKQEPNLGAKYFWAGGMRQCNEPVFHIDEVEEFYLRYEDWMAHDIYKRADTIRIFKKEMEAYTI